MSEIPTLRLEVALDLGVLDIPEEEDYTDLTERIRGFSMKRGRDDQFGTFNAGTATFTLDNSDGMLDPQNPAGIVPVDDEKGLPLCPARVMIDYDGDTWPLMGRCFVGAEPWRVTSTLGTESTVTLELLDPFGAAVWVSTPSSIWKELMTRINPEWWIPGEAIESGVEPTEGFEIPSRGTTTGNATLEHLTLIVPLEPPLLAIGTALTFLDVADGGVDVELALSSGILALTLSAVSYALKPYALIRTDEEDIFPTGDLTDQTVYFQWRSAVTLFDTDDVSTIARCATGDIDGDLRWLLKIDTGDENRLKLDVYDDSGVQITQLVADQPPSGSWVDGSAHGFAIRIQGGVAVDLFADTQQITETVDVPTAAHAGILWLGTAQNATNYGSGAEQYQWPQFDELVVVPRALDDATCGYMAEAPTTPASFGEGDSLADRLNLRYRLCRWELQDGEEDEWHPPPLSIVSPDTTVELGGILGGSTWSDTLAGSLVAQAKEIGGDVYALRNGMIRVRSLLAVEDADLVDVYDTVAVSLTDEPSPGSDPTPIRRGLVSFSGVRLDRVVTECEVSYPLGIRTAGTIQLGQTQSIGPPNRYGRRRVTESINVLSPKVAQALGDLKVTRYAAPPVEIGAVPVDVLLGSDSAEQIAATDWIVKTLELEQAVQVVDTRPGQTARTYELQVQGESWTWDEANRIVVTLNLARS